MNRNKIKAYAPQARRDFIRAVTERAALYGLTKEKAESVVERGDVAVIGGRPYPRAFAALRKRLQERIGHEGFDHVMDAIAYTWFNRLVAIRYMELHEYLDHGFRVLSDPEGRNTPQILEHAEEVDLPGLKREAVIDLKLAGNREAELYRKLLIAQCNALHNAMPFLFERIDDETELLLPDNLLQTDSIVRTLVAGIDEEDWQEVEIIGWLYQFYISEKKDEVIGKVVTSEDIPAATQLFTPNWIVKYLVQNTLGRQWLATYPQSTLRQQMPYYIEPAEQTPEVQEQLKAITPTSLNPEEMTLLDPACGSGHILVEAYDLFKAIYEERGYRAKDIPTLILQKNLFGLEIDDRAAQLAAFALMMKARADDRRIFERRVNPSIVAFQDSQGMDAAAITHALNSPINTEPAPSELLFAEIENENTPLFSKKTKRETGHVSEGDIASLLALFECAMTFGSLIQVPAQLAEKLPEIERRLNEVLSHGDLTHAPAHVINPLLQEARFLAQQYGIVVANPPYMGGKYYPAILKTFVNSQYKEAKGDLYTCFIVRNLALAIRHGLVGMVTIPNWMFLSSFAELRGYVLNRATIDTFIHNGRGVFGPDFGSCSFIIRKGCYESFSGSFRRLFQKQGSVTDNEELEKRFFTAPTYTPKQADFRSIPGQPIAYWISKQMRQCFRDGVPLSVIAPPRQGMATTNNNRFLRFWVEVKYERIGFGITSEDDSARSRKKWFPYNKGGAYRRWFGNNQYVVDFADKGKAICDYIDNTPGTKVGSNGRVINRDCYFLPAVTWTDISSSFFGVRCSDAGFVFDVSGSSVFPPDEWRECIAGFMSCKIASSMLAVLNPTMHFQVGNVAALPVLQAELLARKSSIDAVVRECVELARADWDSFETSWNFQTLPILRVEETVVPRAVGRTLVQSQAVADADYLVRFQRMEQLEEHNNRLFIEAYGLQDEVSPGVSDEQITLYRPDREEDIKRLLSYAVGCMMGRYSLDKLGLIYADSGNQGFDRKPYETFQADDDGIIPLLETDWSIRDDATNRFVEFLSVAWPKEHLEENLKFVADSLGPNQGESPRDTVRRYLATGFYKHHLQTYKRRPIYWLFSSGKQRAFQCLVYLHRYHEGTLSRMRTEYGIPLQGMIASRIEHLAGNIGAATSTAQRKKLEKERETLLKDQAELHVFDEKLRHVADKKITLDLDDGVKVNYGKFGDLLAEVKAVTGGTDED